MLSIRFSRIGKKKMPYFRIIVLDKHKDPFGAFLENLGTYNPRSKELKINADRIKYWIGKGAEASSSIHNILIEKKIIEGKKEHVSRVSKKRLAKIAAKAPASVETPASANATADKPKEEPKAEEKQS